MFVQVIQGQVGDADAARATMERWLQQLKPEAIGWLGGTYGVADDGQLIAVVRFETEADARRNGDRPEQAAWWSDMSRHFTGPITFHDCNDVQLLVGGATDDAQFVQVIQARVKDRDRAHALMERSGSLIARHRPDVLGATIAIDADGIMTEMVFFSSEADARLAESAEPVPEVRALMEEEQEVLEDVRYLDIAQPWFAASELREEPPAAEQG